MMLMNCVKCATLDLAPMPDDAVMLHVVLCVSARNLQGS